MFVRDVIGCFPESQRPLARIYAEPMSRHEACFNDAVLERVVGSIKDIIEQTLPAIEIEKEKILAEPKLDEVSASVLVDRVSPLVERARRELFGQSELFSTAEEAYQRYTEAMEGKLNLQVSPEKEWKTLQRELIEYGFFPTEIAWIKLGGYRQNLSPDMAKRFIWGKARMLSNLTGWSVAGALFHILRGEVPEAPKYSLRVFYNKDGGTSRARLDIYTKDFSYKEIRKVFRQLRKELNVKGRKALNKSDSALFKLCKEERDKKTSWDEILRMWNENHEERPFEYVESICRAYSHILVRRGLPTPKMQGRKRVLSAMRNSNKGGEKTKQV